METLLKQFKIAMNNESFNHSLTLLQNNLFSETDLIECFTIACCYKNFMQIAIIEEILLKYCVTSRITSNIVNFAIISENIQIFQMVVEKSHETHDVIKTLISDNKNIMRAVIKSEEMFYFLKDNDYLSKQIFNFSDTYGYVALFKHDNNVFINEIITLSDMDKNIFLNMKSTYDNTHFLDEICISNIDWIIERFSLTKDEIMSRTADQFNIIRCLPTWPLNVMEYKFSLFTKLFEHYHQVLDKSDFLYCVDNNQLSIIDVIINDYNLENMSVKTKLIIFLFDRLNFTHDDVFNLFHNICRYCEFDLVKYFIYQ